MKTRLFWRVIVCFLSWGMAAVAADPSPETRFAAAYEQEIKGLFREALSGYREALSAVQNDDQRMTGKLLYRIGVCEQKTNRPETARKVWQELLTLSPPDDPIAPRTREAIKALERETDRVRVRGKVLAPNGDGPGLPVAGAWVVAGEWGDEPPVVTDTNGLFSVERRSAGQLTDGRRYVLLYAEHPSMSMAAMATVMDGGAGSDPVEIMLAPTVTVAGRVVDRGGAPVAGARIRIMGIKMAGEIVPVPFDRVTPPVFSDDKGRYTIFGLIPLLRHTVAAERAGYVLERSAMVDGIASGSGMNVPPMELEPIIMRAEDAVSLKGRVVDEMGRGIGVALSAWTPPPIARQVAETNSDDEGFFVFRDVRENLVTLRVNGDGYLDREVIGLKPMGQDVDIVMKRGAGGNANALAGAANATVTGEEKSRPQVGATSIGGYGWVAMLRWLRGGFLNGDAVREEDLRGKVVVLRFSSAYVDASLEHQYPGESRLLSQIQREFGSQDVICLWILPSQDDTVSGRKLALEVGGDYPVAVDVKGQAGVLFGVPPQGGNVVIGRKGGVRCLCDSQHVFKVVKACVGEGVQNTGISEQ